MRSILITVAAMVVFCGCGPSAGTIASCADSCRSVDMRLAYVEVSAVGGSVQSCTCAVKEE